MAYQRMFLQICSWRVSVPRRPYLTSDLFFQKWETKVIASHVAEFETHAPPAQPAVPQLTQHPGYPGVIHPNYAHIPYAPPTGGQPHVKSEPADPRYALSQQNMAYTLPPLPGPHIAMRPNIGGQTSVLSFPPGPPPAQPASLQNGVGTPIGRQYIPPGQQPQRIPQTDGPSESSDDAASPPVYAPRSSHPSLPQPQSQQASSSKTDDDAINSDLDDSDSENEDETEEGASGDQDIVFCTYDKVGSGAVHQSQGLTSVR